ncbi:MAG TPA: LytTR family DNA-binding domain-containing protein [Cyclobacteriaceae bacterium]|jgi:DNA-binding LytR/AlgR family response regulator|nr:LytTR family DNA-binding domain-containing protein [Cyclobacteriaceae bacterium]HRK54379.1 LytTR family DNA-binding domain-containing protein [Cyclobacteriaceae bacterium]
MINCLIVDDEPLARNLLSDYVKKIPYLNLVGTAGNGITAMSMLRENDIDLLLLDIQMPELTGINMLKALHKKPMVILTTAYSEYALESYDLDVVDYLLKPVTFERFLKGLEKVNQRLSNKEVPVSPVEESPSFVFVKDGTKLVKVILDDILYVEGLKDYVTIHTKQQKIVSLQRLKTLEEQLPPEQFIRVHNSFIVSLNAISAIHRSEVQIGTVRVPISDSYKKSFKEWVDKNQLLGGS